LPEARSVLHLARQRPRVLNAVDQADLIDAG